MVTAMKKAAVVCLALAASAAVALAALGGPQNRPNPNPAPATSRTAPARPHPRPPGPPAGASAAPRPAPPHTNGAEMSAIQLTRPGHILAPGATATLPLQTADGDIAYVAATVSPPSQGHGAIAFEITLRLLATLQNHPEGAGLSPSSLEGFTLIGHPGSQPPAPPADPVPGCARPPAPSPLRDGQTVTWCLAAAPDPANAAAAVQYAAADGPYLSPVTWVDPGEDRLP